ncbi:General substrate transporter [Artemisia annua]|uniref:General substrate transporter n=1 Tax=Artemisia annua TaxID=35608 RepID=A0A2U1MVQ8_ARTAN|nr:General substrate transporter [Artemisia annua]
MEGATLNGKVLPEGSLIPARIPVRAPTTDESSLNEPLITTANTTPETSSSGRDEILEVGEFPGLCLAALTMQTVGRKMAMVNMLIMGFVLCLVQTLDQCQTIMTSVHPTRLRTTAVGIAILVGRIGSIVWPLAPAGMGDDMHKTPGMVMFALKIFLSAIFAAMLPLETRLGELADDT